MSSSSGRDDNSDTSSDDNSSTSSDDNSSTSSDENESSSTDSSSSIHTESTNERDSSTTESSPHEKLTQPPTTCHHHHQQCPIHDPYVMETIQWTIRIPIGLGLCPWAIKSHRRSSLKIIACHRIAPFDVAQTMEREIHSLTKNCCREEERAALRTTLVVCPHVAEWMEHFDRFDEFVKCEIQRRRNMVSTTNHGMERDVTLVGFHPKFEKWHALPDGAGVGSIVRSHWDDVGQKSAETAEAEIVEVESRAFGMRKVKVRFLGLDDGFDGRRERYVPVDWIVVPPTQDAEERCVRLPLPDNAMYRSPYPTIHIIDNRDLASLCVADVSRVKRLNARRMMRLGWEGLEKHVEKMKHNGNNCL